MKLPVACYEMLNVYDKVELEVEIELVDDDALLCCCVAVLLCCCVVVMLRCVE